MKKGGNGFSQLIHGFSQTVAGSLTHLLLVFVTMTGNKDSLC